MVTPVKVEPTDRKVEDEKMSGIDTDASAISISIDKVVGNYKPNNNNNNNTTQAKTIKTEGPVTKTASSVTTSTPKPVVKTNHSGSNKPPASLKPSSGQHQTKPPTFKTHPKVSSTLNRLPVKVVHPAAKTSSHKATSASRRPVSEDDDLDPAMYLDPTITITLINSETGEKKSTSGGGIKSSGEISSSDLQVCFYIPSTQLNKKKTFNLHFVVIGS